MGLPTVRATPDIYPPGRRQRPALQRMIPKSHFAGNGERMKIVLI
jgi:hypothetical protein